MEPEIKILQIFTEFYTKLIIAGYKIPISIEVNIDIANSIKNTLHLIKQYTSTIGLKPNECRYNGVLLRTPKDFVW